MRISLLGKCGKFKPTHVGRISKLNDDEYWVDDKLLEECDIVLLKRCVHYSSVRHTVYGYEPQVLKVRVWGENYVATSSSICSESYHKKREKGDVKSLRGLVDCYLNKFPGL